MNFFEDLENAINDVKIGREDFVVIEFPEPIDDHCPACGEDKLTGSGENCPLNSKFDPKPPINKQLLFEQDVTNIKDAIDHYCDGPMTPTVAIARAMQIARRGCYPLFNGNDPITDALEEVLQGHGWLTNDDSHRGNYES